MLGAPRGDKTADEETAQVLCDGEVHNRCKGGKEQFPRLSGPWLAGGCCLQKARTSDREQETRWPPRGSIFVLEGTERVFQTCLSSGPCLLIEKSSL